MIFAESSRPCLLDEQRVLRLVKNHQVLALDPSIRELPTRAGGKRWVYTHSAIRLRGAIVPWTIVPARAPDLPLPFSVVFCGRTLETRGARVPPLAPCTPTTPGAANENLPERFNKTGFLTEKN